MHTINLGHVISYTGASVDPYKLDMMIHWKKLTTLKALREFLGLTDYYWKFIQNYGKIAAPLSKMLKDSHFWTSTAEETFQNLKHAMTKASVFSLLDFSRQFIVECDASGSGVGVVLMQDCTIAFIINPCRKIIVMINERRFLH